MSWRNFLAGWGGLARFWGVVLSLLGAGGVVLQTLGPPGRPAASPARPAKALSDTAGPSSRDRIDVKIPVATKLALPADRPGRSTPGPIADPDPALLEPYPEAPNLKLPRIAVDGRAPMGVYAAGFDPSSLRPRVGLLIAGIGMNEADSVAAEKNLPGGVTLAISPYAGDLSRLLAVARMTEHEYLLSIPMEPQGYPINDPDDRYALMTALSPADNLNRLRGILARLTGYAGVTSALGQMRGERFAGMADQLDAVLEEVEHRGLFFLDARVGHPVSAHAWNRSADLILDDDPVDAAVLDQRLNELTRLALDKGSALGIASVPRSLTVERVAAWTNTLALKGVGLAPVSALVLPPAKQDPEK